MALLVSLPPSGDLARWDCPPMEVGDHATAGVARGNGDPPDSKPDDEQLLARLEEANRLLELDEKSCPSLANYSPTPGHSRKGSGSSVVSSTSSNSHYSNQASCEDDASSNAVPGETLWDTWGRLVNEWDSVKKKTTYIKDLVRRGIPHHFRGLAWQLLLGVHDSEAKLLYAEYMKKTSPCEKQIRRDIARTFPEHDFFKEKDGLGQESLFNVMKAYSLHDREVGYCQGSGFIVGLLLMQMPEEEAFAVVVKLMQEYRLRELFKPSMAELGLCMFKLECLIQELLPTMFMHFQSQNFHTSMYASSWFLTLFATSLSLSGASRVMDIFISEGMEVVFRVAVALLMTCQEELLALDMEGMLKFFQKDLRTKFDSDPDRILQTAFQIRYSHKKMKKLEKEYTALKTKENEEQIELRRLRTENNLLRQRIDGLEKESASLADRLIHDQVTRAQEAEEMYALKNDLAVTRSQLAETQKRLETADVLLADIKKRTNSIDSAGKLEETEARALVCQLQEELIAVRLREAETTTMVKELRTKIKELEDTNLQLQRAPSNDVQHLQEELVAVKLREAESNLSLKELRQKVNELETYWERHLERVFATGSGASPKEKNSKQEVRQLQDDLMTVRLREANAVAEIKDCKQKIMELETQNHICTNQIRRMDDENKVLKDKIQEKEQKEKELMSQTKELLRKIDDLESKRREEMMMVRIQEAETAQQMGELRQRIAQLEIQKEEIRAAGQLDVKEGTQDLEDKIYDLQDEVMQLRLQASPKHGGPSRTGQENHNGADEEDEDNEDDDDDDDEDVMESTQNLNKTLSDIIEGRSFVDTSLESSRLQEEETSAEVKSESSGFTKDTAVLDSSTAPHTNGALPPTEATPPGGHLSQPDVAADG